MNPVVSYRLRLVAWLVVCLIAFPITTTESSLANSIGDNDVTQQQHWSLRPITVPPIPNTHEPAVAENAIDAFIRARLDQEGLEPSPRAYRETLVRRVTLDLIGLPQTPQDVAAFVDDDRPDAYQRLVDRLIASPHYGERWVRPWLDVAHYADSDGYLTDQSRPYAWRFRQWLIDVLNRDMPFDQFTIEQLAGDLLPNSTAEQKLATGFLRQTLSNREGGADLEEYRVIQVKDRTSTVSTVWLGLTTACAECHDHKFDPISQREYYELYAFFNSADEVNIDAPLPQQVQLHEVQREEYNQRRQKLIGTRAVDITELQRRWELKMLQTAANSGEDYRWDRKWEVLGLVWGGKYGEGQLEGQEIVRLDPAQRTPAQQARLMDYFLRWGSAIDQQRYDELELGSLNTNIRELHEQLPNQSRAPSMRQSPRPRDTYVQIAGVFNDYGDVVAPRVPSCLPALPAEGPSDRLALAKWLVSPSNPLASRVTVNRMWQDFFGRGLVSTSADFGTRGEPPTHPELLDWLANELIEQDWSMKSMHERIVTSATYCQSSTVRPELSAHDPSNKLLARQSSLRFTAEAVRDCTLAVSGLLVDKIGGQSVVPRQPEGEDMEKFGNDQWTESEGEDRYRRAFYTSTRRTAPFPQLETFDAPTARDTCTRRERSNTPLQALTLLNDPVFFEAAQALAKRILREHHGNLDQRIEYGFRICTSRLPAASEKESLRASYQRLHEILQQEPTSASKIVAIPNADMTSADMTSADMGAWVGLSSILLNLHEFITRD